MIIWKEATFDSSHRLENTPFCDYGKCNNFHGHTYKLQVGIEGQPDPKTGMVINFVDLKAMIEELKEIVDHVNLDEAMPHIEDDWHLPTTCENMATAFQRWFQRKFPENKIHIRLWETPTSFVEV